MEAPKRKTGAAGGMALLETAARWRLGRPNAAGGVDQRNGPKPDARNASPFLFFF
ncbi:MAG: hypothetical protein IK077_06705 [Thermoguttaceae bacterium]|nr:hypothetical protein [Thermoguttaceae bacterium]